MYVNSVGLGLFMLIVYVFCLVTAWLLKTL